MKTVKNDTRYIIKRIIIGVGIALILAFINNNRVFAEEVSRHYCMYASSNITTNCNLSSSNSYSILLYQNSIIGNTYFDFVPLTSSTAGITIGLENATNGDYLLLQRNLITSFGTRDTIGYYNYSGNSYYPVFYTPSFDLEHNAISIPSGEFAIFITTEYARALEYQDSTLFDTSPTLQNVDDYYFVFGMIPPSNISSLLNNYFLSFDWPYNILSYSSFYENINTQIQVLNSSGQSDYSINIVEQSNNINIDDYWIQGFTEGGNSFIDDTCTSGGLCTDNIQSFMDLLTIPFNWLKSLNKDSCTSISIPIPFTNGNITINCLSTKFREILGNNFYNILTYIISGLLVYRITIRNIDTITDILNPDDDKLEVINL